MLEHPSSGQTSLRKLNLLISLERGGNSANAGFTLIELLVSLGLLAIVTALLLPVFKTTIESGRSTSCMAQLRQFGVGIAAYAQENNGLVPPAKVFFQNQSGGESNKVWYKDQDQWAYTYVAKDPKTMQRLLRCPTDRTPLDRVDYNTYTWSSYLLINWNLTDSGPKPRTAPRLLRMGDIQRKIVLLDGVVKSDGEPFYSGASGISGALADSNPHEAISKRHRNGANCLFGDGTVAWKPKQELVDDRPLWGGNPRL